MAAGTVRLPPSEPVAEGPLHRIGLGDALARAQSGGVMPTGDQATKLRSVINPFGYSRQRSGCCSAPITGSRKRITGYQVRNKPSAAGSDGAEVRLTSAPACPHCCTPTVHSAALPPYTLLYTDRTPEITLPYTLLYTDRPETTLPYTLPYTVRGPPTVRPAVHCLVPPTLLSIRVNLVNPCNTGQTVGNPSWLQPVVYRSATCCTLCTSVHY